MAATNPHDRERLNTTARLTALTLANAFIAQAELAEADPRVQPLRKTLDQQDPVAALQDHWAFITREIDYVPIFGLARRVLLELPPRAEVYQAIRTLGSQVLAIVSERAALRHDLMGRIYHRLLLEAKYLGTFYTSVPAATLLLKMALAPKRWGINWGDPGAVARLRIADLACGTGTLLMAAQQAVTDNYVGASADAGQAINPQDIRELNRVLIEDVIHGYDVLSSAVHLTASTLAMLAPELAFHAMHLYVVPMGVQPNGTVALGSIDFLQTSSLHTQLDLMGTEQPATPVEVTGTGDQASSATLPMLDLCVMNPPFVRSVGGNLLFGSLPKEQRSKMQAKLSKLLGSTNVAGQGVLASATAGLGSVFVAVAHRHIRPNGRIALVLPASLAFGVAWEKTRQLFAREYAVEYLVVSHDPEKWSFSENTNLSEILVVAKKLDGKADNQAETVCVNLWRNTSTPVDALALADSILHGQAGAVESSNTPASQGVAPLVVNGTKRGEKVSLPWRTLRNGQWYGCAYAQTDLVRLAHGLRDGHLESPAQQVSVKLPLVSLETLGELGPDRRDIFDGFQLTDSATSYPALWGHDQDEMKTVSARANKYLSPRVTPSEGRPIRRLDQLWPKAGRLMLVERLRLNTQRVVAVRLSDPALSNVWWPLHLYEADEKAEKALTLWVNSTPGLVSFISYRAPTEGSWVQFKKPILQGMPVLDIRTLTAQQKQDLATAYDSVAEATLLPLSQMGEDPTRQAIDEAVSKALGLPVLDSLRRALGREPTISGVRL